MAIIIINIISFIINPNIISIIVVIVVVIIDDLLTIPPHVC